MAIACWECDFAFRRSRSGLIYCVVYGMVLPEDHLCIREGAKKRDGDGCDRIGRIESEAELSEDGGGAAGEVPGILPESGE